MNISDGRHLETVFACMGEGLLVADTDLMVSTVNPLAARMLNRTQENLMGKDLRSVFSIWSGNEKLLGDKDPLVKTIKSKMPQQATVEDNFVLEAIGQSSFPVAFTIAPLLENNEVRGVVMVFSDVTSARQLRQARTDFISIAAHQLRTPLTPVRWFAKLLLTGEVGNLNPEQKEFIGYIYENNDRMVQLLNTLLEIVHVEEGKISIEPKPMDMNAIAAQVIESLEPLADKRHIEIVIDKQETDLPQIPVDAVIMWQVLQNLITNAIRYSYEHTTVHVGFVHTGNYMEAYVRNQGMGIPAGLRDKIYHRFFRSPGAVKAAPEGSGLGLYLVKLLVESWGGKIWFDSEQDRETTFYFTLPLSGMKPTLKI